ncbi:MAG: DUF423 domain-containing protein [Promethearchaeia archaeon]
MLAVGAGQAHLSPRAFRFGPPLMLTGTALFSGSLYLMVVTNKKALGTQLRIADHTYLCACRPDMHCSAP